MTASVLIALVGLVEPR